MVSPESTLLVEPCPSGFLHPCHGTRKVLSTPKRPPRGREATSQLPTHTGDSSRAPPRASAQAPRVPRAPPSSGENPKPPGTSGCQTKSGLAVPILEKCPVLGNFFLSAFPCFPRAAPGFSPAARENLALQTRGWEIPASTSPKQGQELAFFFVCLFVFSLNTPRDPGLPVPPGRKSPFQEGKGLPVPPRPQPDGATRIKEP